MDAIAKLQSLITEQMEAYLPLGEHWISHIPLGKNYANMCVRRERGIFAVPSYSLAVFFPDVKRFTDPRVSEYIFTNQDRFQEVHPAGTQWDETVRLWKGSPRPVERRAIDTACRQAQDKRALMNINGTLRGALSFHFRDFRNEDSFFLSRTSFQMGHLDDEPYHHLVLCINQTVKPLTPEKLNMISYFSE